MTVSLFPGRSIKSEDRSDSFIRQRITQLRATRPRFSRTVFLPQPLICIFVCITTFLFLKDRSVHARTELGFQNPGVPWILKPHLSPSLAPVQLRNNEGLPGEDPLGRVSVAHFCRLLGAFLLQDILFPKLQTEGLGVFTCSETSRLSWQH